MVLAFLCLFLVNPRTIYTTSGRQLQDFNEKIDVSTVTTDIEAKMLLILLLQY